MGFETYSNMWKALVDAGSACVLASGGNWDPQSAPCRRLQQVLDESGQMRIALAMSHPTHLTAYHYAMGQVASTALATQSGRCALLTRTRAATGPFENALLLAGFRGPKHDTQLPSHCSAPVHMPQGCMLLRKGS